MGSQEVARVEHRWSSGWLEPGEWGVGDAGGESLSTQGRKGDGTATAGRGTGGPGC
jgi:hypothetical protein